MAKSHQKQNCFHLMHPTSSLWFLHGTILSNQMYLQENHVISSAAVSGNENFKHTNQKFIFMYSVQKYNLTFKNLIGFGLRAT